MKLRLWATACLSVACASAPLRAAGQGAAPYPFSLETGEVSRWLRAETDAPAAGLVGVGDGRAFVLAPGASASGMGGATEATVQVEALTPRAAALMHGRSMRIEAEVRCADRQVELATTATYAGTRQAGSPSDVRRGPGYAAAPTGSMLDRVVDKVCGPGDSAPSPAPIPPPPAELSREPTAAARPPAIAAPEQTAEPPAPSAAPEAAPASASPSARSARPGAGGSAQIGAFPSAEDADAAWRKARGLVSPDGLRLRTEPVRSGGRTLYRALVEGFDSHAAAERFCAALKGAGLPCLVRR